MCLFINYNRVNHYPIDLELEAIGVDKTLGMASSY